MKSLRDAAFVEDGSRKTEKRLDFVPGRSAITQSAINFLLVIVVSERPSPFSKAAATLFL